jgi:membrane-associated PAP2 superfamily phosphatase
MPWITRARWLMLWLGLPLLVVVAWDVSSADMAVAHWYGNTQGFGLANNYWLSNVLHTRVRQTAVLLGLACVLAIWWPLGPWRNLTRRERVWLAVMLWVCAAGIATIKATSHSSCPSNLQEFGGATRYVWHFAWPSASGVPGRCFPSGHASTFFSFLVVFWVLHLRQPQRAWWVLGMLCALGLALSWVQVVRGEHFASHILWTAWLCWVACAAASPWLQPRALVAQPLDSPQL